MIPVIETERLRLREWRAADFEPYAALYGDAQTMRHIGGACERDLAWTHLTATIGHWALRGYGLWALEFKTDPGLIGWAGLWNPEGWPEPEIGWTLTPAARGKGLATEAALRARAWAYEDMGWTTAVSLIAMPNQASIAVAERLGARMERTMMFRDVETGIFRHPDKSGNVNFNRNFSE